MFSVNSNYGSWASTNAVKQSQKKTESSIEKLSTGSRINSAKDDPSGLAISMRLTSQIEGIKQGTHNAHYTQKYLQTAENSLSRATHIFMRMKEIALKASNGLIPFSGNHSQENDIMSLEMEELQKELRSLGGLTIAGVSPFNHPDASGTHRINTGANQNDEYNFVLNDYQDWAADAVNPDDVYFNDYLLDFNMEKDSLHPYHHEHAHWDFQENLKYGMGASLGEVTKFETDIENLVWLKIKEVYE